MTTKGVSSVRLKDKVAIISGGAHKLCSISLILFLLLALVSCNFVPSSPTQSIYKSEIIPIASASGGSSPTESEESPDDIVNTPAGQTYRANVHQEGIPDRWPSIETAEVPIGSGSEEIYVTYRRDITTNSGETRNNIISVRWPNTHLKDIDSLDLYCAEIPPSLTLAQESASGLIGTVEKILTIGISKDLKPGRYTLNVGLIINDKNYGTIPCNIDVLNVK